MSEAISTVGELAPHLRSHFFRRAQTLQMLPAVAIQALEVTKDPDCSIPEFVGIVERDAKLATDILGMSNSPLFSTGGSRILSLHQSVVRLGFQQCKNLILSSSIASMMRNLPMEEEWIRDVLSRHAFTTGIVAMHINRVIGAGFHGEEFAAGLMHDFGRAILAVCLPDQFSAADPLDFDESHATLVAESRMLGTNHCEAGAWFAELNGLPSEFVEVIRYHHTPSNALKHPRLVALIALSDHIANHMQRFDGSDNYDLTANEAIMILQWRNLTKVAGRLQDMIPEIIQSARQDVEQMISF